ncbi:SDR family NAD(P)-dependent oxidoreductase [Frankia sp. CcI49]|uniref:SDR family NAD(P)-dependent oxidoreductase n=1 Tax=Frankia sp. CcI49 TaxID=1745382 RepID=UPI0018E9E94F|nr:SDR family NAD(P)-dependent oxidoreductase [Frankia sp. CcI49]
MSGGAATDRDDTGSGAGGAGGPVGPGPLAGRVAVVTGAGQGLGRAEALALAAAGASVIVNDLAESVADTAEEINASGGAALAMRGDIGDWEVGASLVQAAVDAFGGFHILVNNAGFIRDRMLFSLPEEDWDAVVRVHLRGHAGTCRAAMAYWRERSKAVGGPVEASVVNTTSESFLLAPPGQPNYAAAKAGVTALTLSTAQGAARYGVRANAVAPRARTAMTSATFRPAPDEGPDPFAPEHVATVVTWLASPASAPITGQVLITYGTHIGVLARPRVEAVYTAAGDTWTADELSKTLGAEARAGAHDGYAVPPAELRLD